MSIRGTLSPRSFKDARARRTIGSNDLPAAHTVRARKKHRPYTHGLVLVIISAAASLGIFTSGGLTGRSEAFGAPVTGLSLPGVGSSIPTADQTVLRPPAINKTKRVEQPISQNQQETADQFAALSATPTSVAVVVQEEAVVRAASDAPAPQMLPYQVVEVNEGDTVASIGERYGISPEYIIANNAEIVDSNVLSLGQAILVPAGNGILHEVRFGETLSDIAARYDVDVEVIAEFAPNRISTVNDITEAQMLFVPDARPNATAPVPAAETAPDSTEDATPVPDDASSGEGTGSDGEIVADGPSSGEGLVWPIVGPVSSYYGSSHPLGIDIDGFNLGGAAVGAATSGTVVFAGGNACCSYGLYVVVVSPGGVETLYAHLSSIYVSQGDAVSQGEAIGVIGDTGYSTGTHLHFEVIDNGTRVNPLSYLP